MLCFAHKYRLNGNVEKKREINKKKKKTNKNKSQNSTSHLNTLSSIK